MKSAVAYILTSLASVPLMLLAASEGGVFAWAALIYLTLFTFLLDEVLATALEAKPTQTGAPDRYAANAKANSGSVFVAERSRLCGAWIRPR